MNVEYPSFVSIK